MYLYLIFDIFNSIFPHPTTLWGVPSFLMFCKVFLTCSTGRLADTAAIEQPDW